MRDLDTFKHSSNEYAILSLYFFSKNNEDNLVMTKITQEVHLMNDFKINMLIENNLIDFEEIIIDVVSKSIFINNCDVIVSIKVKTS